MFDYKSYTKYLEFFENNKAVATKKPLDPALITKTKSTINFANASIIGHYKFFGELVYKLRFVYTDLVPTMATDYRHIFINPNFVETMTDEETRFVICHEILHNVMGHQTRRGMRNNKIWNYAADYEINPMLVEEGLISLNGKKLVFKSGFEGCYDEKYIGMAAEEIYDLIKNDIKQDMKKQLKKQMAPPRNPEVGDYVRTKDKKYCKVTKVNSNGTFETEKVTLDEVREAAKKAKGQ